MDIVKTLLKSILDINIENLKDEDINPDNIMEWDSLTHFNIVAAIEEQFNIELNPEDIMRAMQGYNDIIDILRNYGVNI